MIKAVVDANVILELLLKRSRANDILTFFEENSFQFIISPLTIHLAYYFSFKADIEPRYIKSSLQSFTILNMDARAVQIAQERLKGRDFEDCLQAAAAEEFGCDLIITLDQRFAKSSATTIKVLVL